MLQKQMTHFKTLILCIFNYSHSTPVVIGGLIVKTLQLRCLPGAVTQLFLWKLLRSASLGMCTQLKMRGWKKKEVMKNFTDFQFVSLTTCKGTQVATGSRRKLEKAAVQGVWQSPGQGGEAHGELASWTGRWWQQPHGVWVCRTVSGNLLTVPCGLFFKSEDGGFWSTTGEVALQGKAGNCELSQL